VTFDEISLITSARTALMDMSRAGQSLTSTLFGAHSRRHHLKVGLVTIAVAVIVAAVALATSPALNMPADVICTLLVLFLLYHAARLRQAAA